MTNLRAGASLMLGCTALSAALTAHAGSLCLQSAINEEASRYTAAVKVSGPGLPGWASATQSLSRPSSCARFTATELRAQRGQFQVQVDYKRAPMGGRVGVVTCPVNVADTEDQSLLLFLDDDTVAIALIDRTRGPVPLNAAGDRFMRCK